MRRGGGTDGREHMAMAKGGGSEDTGATVQTGAQTRTDGRTGQGTMNDEEVAAEKGTTTDSLRMEEVRVRIGQRSPTGEIGEAAPGVAVLKGESTGGGVAAGIGIKHGPAMVGLAVTWSLADHDQGREAAV